MVLTTYAKELVASFLAGNAQTRPTHIAFGTNATAPNSEDATLTSEFNRITLTETSLTGNEIQFTTIMTTAQGNGTTFKELGLFNASTSGTMFTRSVFVDIDKTSSFEIQATIILKVN